MKIFAPVSDFNGWRGNVRFVNGVAETDDLQAIKWFETHGYILEKCDELFQETYEKCEEPHDQIEYEDDEVEMMGYAEKPLKFEDMTPNELRDWAKTNGFGSRIKNIRNKEKLIEILRGDK